MWRMIRTCSVVLFVSFISSPCAAESGSQVVHQHASFHPLDYVALTGYLVVLVWIGFYFSRREKTTADLFLAGRRAPWWAAALSVFGTHLSAVTFMAIPAKAFAADWVTILVNLGIILVAPVTVFCFLPIYRRLELTSVYEYLELRFSAGLRVYGSLAFVTYQLAKMGIFLLLPAIALATVTGFNVYACIAVMGLLCIVYTVLGGIEAVVWTDVLQSIVLLGGALLSMGVILSAEDFAIGTMLQTAVEEHKFHIFTLEGGLDSNVFWVVIVGGFFIQLTPFTSDQALVQRFLTTPDEKTATRAVWAHAALVVPASLLFFGLGTALFLFYKTRPEMMMPTNENDKIVPWFIVTQLPVGLAGLVLAGLFAATMSSVDSGMHSISTTLVNDVYRKLRPKADDAACLKMARILIISFGLLGTLSAVLVSRIDAASLWMLTLLLVGLFGSSLTGVFLLGVLTQRANARGTVLGVASSIGTLITLQNMDPRPINGLLTAAVGALTCVFVGYFASLLLPEPDRPLANLTLRTLEPAHDPS